MSMHKLSSTASEHPGVFYTVLLAFHLFPLHAPLTTFGLIDAPFGRFSQKDSRWNVDGKLQLRMLQHQADICLFYL